MSDADRRMLFAAARVAGQAATLPVSSGLRWPSSSRRIAVATDMATADVDYGFGLGCGKSGGLVALGTFSGVDISIDGRNWFPLVAGSSWPVSRTTERAIGVRLRRSATGAGTLVLAVYEKLPDAVVASLVSGGGLVQIVSAAGGATSARTQFSGGATATGAAAEYVRQAGNIKTTVVALVANTAAVFLAATAARATAAAGFRLNAGASTDWVGPLFTFSAAAQNVDLLEHIA